MEEENKQHEVKQFYAKVLIQLGQVQTVIELAPRGVDEQDAASTLPELVNAFIRMNVVEFMEVKK